MCDCEVYQRSNQRESTSIDGSKDGKLEDLQTLEGAEGVFENGSAKEDCLARHINGSDNFCPAYHDGILCWEPTPWHTFAIQRCFKELNGLQYDDTRKCYFFTLAINYTIRISTLFAYL